MMVWSNDDGWYHDVYAVMKGKGKQQKKGKFKPSANVYGMDLWSLEMVSDDFSTSHDDAGFHMFPMELFSTNENASTQRSIPPGHGMLDCGATASAGPEASAKKLISFLLHYDPNLQVSFNYQKRPYFRYGSGKWGRAMYHAVIHPSWDSSRCFELYVLDNPAEYGQDWFTDDLLVPILVGMDYLQKTGLILDFTDGHAVNGHDVNPEPYTIEKNVKGHFMVNIAHYLFGNLSATEAGNPAEFAAKSLEQAWTPGYEETWGDDWFELTMLSTAEGSSHDHMGSQHDRRDLFNGFLQRRLRLNHGVVSPATESQVQQPSSSTALTSNGPEVGISSTGLLSRDRCGSDGLSKSPHLLAMFRRSQELRAQVQRLCSMVPVRDLWSEGLLRSAGILPRQACDSGGPQGCGDGHEAARDGSSSPHSDARQGPGRDHDPDPCQRSAVGSPAPEVAASSGTSEGPEARVWGDLQQADQQAFHEQQCHPISSNGCVALPECGREDQVATDCREPPSGGGEDEGGSGAGAGASSEPHLGMNDAEPSALQSPTLIEDVTKMGNLSMAYETVDAEMSAEHYGNVELLESAQGLAAEIEFMMCPEDEKPQQNFKNPAKKSSKTLKNKRKRLILTCTMQPLRLQGLPVLRGIATLEISDKVSQGRSSRPLWLSWA